MFMKNNQRTAIGKALFAVIVWGASFVATKVSLRYVSPITVIWLRFAIGVAVLGLAVAIRRQFKLPDKNEWLYFSLLGFLGVTFHQWLQSTGLVTAQATTTGWIVASTPIFMAILGFLVLNEKLVWFQMLGIFLAATGVLLVVSRGDFSQLSTGNLGTPGDFLVLLSAPNWAVFSTLSRRGLQKQSAALMMFYVMSFGWLFSSILFISSNKIHEIPHIAQDGWAGILFLGIFCSGIAYIFWYDALQILSTAQTGAFLYFEPIITVMVASVILSEKLIPVTMLGGAIILIGVWLVSRTKPLSQVKPVTD